MKKIVTVSGGTGGYNLLSGIKKLKNLNISAIVCMSDSGGTTGVLRDELGVLPPGDVRQCLVALSEETEIVRRMMSYRFENGKLEGFSFGSILIAVLEKVTGSFSSGVETASRILKINGDVIPVINNDATLLATLTDGKKIEGEKNIYNYHNKENPIKFVSIKENPKINIDAKVALQKADFIIIGPGDHFCSILPNLITVGFKEVIENCGAKIIYVANLTNRSGHNLNWTLNKYVSEVEKNINRKIDFIIVNKDKISKKNFSKYLEQEGSGVEILNDMLQDKRVINASVLAKIIHKKQKGDPNKSYIRHDSDKLGNVIKKIIFRK